MNLSQGMRRGLLAAAVCIILYGAAGFLLLPSVIKVQGEKRLSAGLGRIVTIERVRVNPFMLSLALEDFDIKEREGKGSFLGWSRLYVRFDALRSLAGAWVLGDIELEGFHAGVVVNPNGSFNFSDVLAKLAPPSAPAPAAPGRPFRVCSLRVAQARVSFDDRSLKVPFSTVIGPLTFDLKEFRTAGGSGAPYHFEASTEAGERLSFSGTLSADPLKSRGELAVEDLVVKKYSPYFERRIQADVADGRLSFRGRYEADFDPKNRLLALSDAELHLHGLRVSERSTGKALLELRALDVAGVQADGVALKASVGRVSLAGGHVSVRRDKGGSINLLSIMPAGTEEGNRAPPATSAPAAVPQVSVGEVALADFSIGITDEAVPHGARLSIGGLQVSLKNFTLADGAVMPLRASFGWAPKGTVKIDGTVVLKPDLKAELRTDVAAFEVLPLSPYLEQLFNARITQGALSTSSSLHASLSKDRPSFELRGDISLDKFGLVDGARDKDLLGFTWLAVAGLKVGTAPKLAASIAEVDLVDPYVRVRVNADKTLNIAAIAAPAGTPLAGPAEASPAPRVEIGRVVIEGGDFSFSDLSVEPNVRVSLEGFSGTVSGLSSENLARADVNLKGMVGGSGPVEISGKLDPLGAHKYVDLKIDVRNVDLLPLSPYSGKYAGYELARGQLVVDSKILVDGTKLDATNKVTVNQFTFGAPSNSRDATGLPVRLAVALLKDIDGKIFIDLPVQGSLDDPEFRVGKVVLRIITNLLTKAAVSPFSLIGSMFGGGGEELAFQEFDPGSSELQPSQLPKLETLAKALANRPGLSLGIEGGFDSAADTYALRRLKLAQLVRRQIWEERHAADPNIPPPDQLPISADENAAMVRKLFNAKFPPGTQFGAPLAPAPVVAAPPPGPAPGLIRRIVEAVTFKRQRDESAARKETERLAAERAKEVAKAAASVPLDQMTGRLAESIEVTSDDLGALATERAQRVRDHLIDPGRVGADRLFLTKGAGGAGQVQGPRVRLTFQ